MSSRKLSILERFEQLFIPEPMSGCWIWIGGGGGEGNSDYGRFWNGERKVGAHRFGYEAYSGKKIPRGFDVHHKCVNSWCVYWRHTKPTPPAVNQGYRRQRYCPRHRCRRAKVSGRYRCRKCHAAVMRAYRERRRKVGRG